MNKNKNIVIAVIAVVVIVVGIVVIAGRGGGSSPAVTQVDTESPVASATTTASASSGTTATSPSGSKIYGNASFSFDYPSSWSLVSSKPVTIDNFNAVYEKNDVIPMGGAQIKVATATLESGRIQDVLGTELLSATGVVTSTLTVDGSPCLVAQYTGPYVGKVATQNESVYCLRGIGLWKIYLSYRAGDPNAAGEVGTFNGVLTSMKLLK